MLVMHSTVSRVHVATVTGHVYIYIYIKCTSNVGCTMCASVILLCYILLQACCNTQCHIDLAVSVCMCSLESKEFSFINYHYIFLTSYTI